ncbi:hypothetical protein M0813_11894 [Anaeramoeba flamelloides]|uniref:B30.2/SPRY domain-containing protein n=1 Tax=Anaeramoeba flamelloides TaxID=1746091 RepID=A0ABQ8ZDS6_9EUKA|nr:hypothetical protein M0813_11894 [Anaeramoeba flamelloides]
MSKLQDPMEISFTPIKISKNDKTRRCAGCLQEKGKIIKAICFCTVCKVYLCEKHDNQLHQNRLTKQHLRNKIVEETQNEITIEKEIFSSLTNKKIKSIKQNFGKTKESLEKIRNKEIKRINEIYDHKLKELNKKYQESIIVQKELNTYESTFNEFKKKNEEMETIFWLQKWMKLNKIDNYINLPQEELYSYRENIKMEFEKIENIIKGIGFNNEYHIKTGIEIKKDYVEIGKTIPVNVEFALKSNSKSFVLPKGYNVSVILIPMEIEKEDDQRKFYKKLASNNFEFPVLTQSKYEEKIFSGEIPAIKNGFYRLRAIVNNLLIPSDNETKIIIYNSEKWDSERSGNYVQLTNGNKTVTTNNRTDSRGGLETARGTTVFTSGIHHFILNIDKLGSSSWGHFGVIGSQITGRGWSRGYIFNFVNCLKSNNKNIPYGKYLKTNDYIVLELDSDKKTMTFYHKFESLGMAFDNLPSSLILCFDIYGTNIQVTLL